MSLAFSSPVYTFSPAGKHRHLSVDGVLDAEAILGLRSSVLDAMADGPAIVFLDVSSITRVTPSGLAGLLDLLRVTRTRGGDFRAYGRSSVLSNARSALKLTSVIAVYPSRSAALAGAH